MSESSTSHGSARPLEVDHGSRLLKAGHGPRLAAPKGLGLDSPSHRCALIKKIGRISRNLEVMLVCQCAPLRCHGKSIARHAHFEQLWDAA